MTSIYRSDDARRAVEERYRVFLDGWPVPSTESVLPTRQGDTFVVACGDEHAPPIVLLHGAGFNSAAWLGDVESWARSHRVYSVDVIGEPGLSAPSRPSPNSDAYATWLDDVWDGLGVTQAAVVGTSLGGWMALDYALRRPERVTKLVLLVPAGIGRQRYGAIITSLFLMPFGERGQRAGMRYVLGPAGAPVSGPMAATLKAFDDYLWLVHKSYRPRRDRLPVFGDDRLRGLNVPLLFIAGEKDRILDSHHSARRLRHLVPGAVVTLVADTGHIPTGYAETVQRFLTGDAGE
ncbi:alpha/beta hydrolase [Polymorphospora sp. NPDC051019]|uniref:alpha/beta fold hydrolase n=1 Tax=Polymorphospora sp. NPDC051019 TaxID=3155725 RepID=UPI003444BCA2